MLKKGFRFQTCNIQLHQDSDSVRFLHINYSPFTPATVVFKWISVIRFNLLLYYVFFRQMPHLTWNELECDPAVHVNVFKNRTKDGTSATADTFWQRHLVCFPRGCRSVGGLLTRPGRVSPKWFPYDRTSHNDTHQCHYQTSQTEHSSFPSLPLFSVIISSILRYKFQFLFELDVFFFTVQCVCNYTTVFPILF